jgi:hypothetical protein
MMPSAVVGVWSPMVQLTEMGLERPNLQIAGNTGIKSKFRMPTGQLWD